MALSGLSFGLHMT